MRFLQSIIQDSQRPLQPTSAHASGAVQPLSPTKALEVDTPGHTPERNRVQKPSSEHGTQRVVARTAANGHRPEPGRAPIPLAQSELSDESQGSERAQQVIHNRKRDDEKSDASPTFDDIDRDLKVALESRDPSVDVSESDIASTTTRTSLFWSDESAMPPNPDHFDPLTEPEIESAYGREKQSEGRQATGSATPSEPRSNWQDPQTGSSGTTHKESDIEGAPSTHEATLTAHDGPLSEKAEALQPLGPQPAEPSVRHPGATPIPPTMTEEYSRPSVTPDGERPGVRIGQVDITLQQDVRQPARRHTTGSAFNTRRFLSRNYLRRL